MYLLDLASDVKEFAEKLLGPSVEELGLIFGDKVRLFRLKNSIKVFKRAKDMLREAGFSEPKPVDLKTLIPLLENCSLEDENSELIEKWAGLLASASSGGLKIYSYPHILNQLSAIEAKILDNIYQHTINEISQDDLCNSLDISKSEFLVYLDNLYRMELCQPSGSAPTYFGGTPVSPKRSNIVGVTYLGAAFVEACRGPRKQTDKSS